MNDISGKILGRRDLTDRITEFRIGKADGTALPSFEAGAHITCALGDGMARDYSLITFTPPEPEPTEYCIAVQREPGGQGGSEAMHALKEGDALTFSAPSNDFPLSSEAPALLLAGGIGITPMTSMAATLKAQGQSFDLHFAGRSEAVMAYRTDLADLCGASLHLHRDDADGPHDLTSLIAGLGDRHLYICGPRGLIDAARAAAEAAGVPSDRVHVELFDTPSAATGDTSFEVELASSGDVYTVAPGQSIIDALEAGGVDVMYDCQRGDCGICQCDVISGEPDHRDVVLSEAERASGKVMQICVSRSKSPRLVLDL